MNSFTISDLQRFSGVSVHSIRAWEKRYQTLSPNRSEGNTRYYDGNQLRRLLNIASLLNSGYKISELSTYTDKQLHELLLSEIEWVNPNENDEFLINQFVAAGMDFNELHFEKIYSRAIVKYGIEDTYIHLIYPALNRIGLLWSADRIAPAQEHFISSLIKQKLYSAIDILDATKADKHHWLLFLPENEFHECGLLMANLIARKAGIYCTYLGSNVPFDTLSETVARIKPNALLFFFVNHDSPENDFNYIKNLTDSFKPLKIYGVSNASRWEKIKPVKSFNPISTIAELKQAIQSLSI